MTEKELRKLKRRDFLQLLLTQGKEMSAVQARMDETLEKLEQVDATNERLKAKLDEKDELIEKLKGRLDSKDETISQLRQEIENIKENRRIELEQSGSIAMAALKLNGVFDTAQKAADQYLYNIHLMYDELAAKTGTEKAPEKPAESPAEAVREEHSLQEEAQASVSDTEDAEKTELKNRFLNFLRGLNTR